MLEHRLVASPTPPGLDWPAAQDGPGCAFGSAPRSGKGRSLRSLLSWQSPSELWTGFGGSRPASLTLQESFLQSGKLAGQGLCAEPGALRPLPQTLCVAFSPADKKEGQAPASAPTQWPPLQALPRLRGEPGSSHLLTVPLSPHFGVGPASPSPPSQLGFQFLGLCLLPPETGSCLGPGGPSLVRTGPSGQGRDVSGLWRLERRGTWGPQLEGGSADWRGRRVSAGRGGRERKSGSPGKGEVVGEPGQPQPQRPVSPPTPPPCHPSPLTPAVVLSLWDAQSLSLSLQVLVHLSQSGPI